jgi:hypothetical protein
MRVSDLFDISYGNSLELNVLKEDPSGINFVSRTTKNNGVSGKVVPIPGIEANPAGSLSVALSATPLETFLQPDPFYTGFHVAVLIPKRPMTTEEKLWWAMCLRAHQYRYSYGRQANRTLKDLELPEEMPVWAKGLTLPDLDTVKKPLIAEPVILPDPSTWRAFRYDELFDIERGDFTPTVDILPGDTPLIRSTEQNNGLGSFVSLPTRIHPASTISVARNGSVGEAFYQELSYHASDDVHVFYPKRAIDVAQGLFLCALIRAEKYRYGYGRKWSLDRMKPSIMRLPVDERGEPAWELMGRYMSSLSFSTLLDPKTV